MFWKRLYSDSVIKNKVIKKIVNDILTYINKKEITCGVNITSAIQLYILYVITRGPQWLEVNLVIVLN